jgi:hypothetical protein
VLRDLFEVSKRVTEARANVLTTGKANQAFANAEGLIGKVMESSITQRAATAAAGLVPGGGLVAPDIIQFMSKSSAERIKAAGKLFADDGFQKLAIEAATKGTPSANSIRRTAMSQSFQNFADAAKIPKALDARIQWLQTATQAERQFTRRTNKMSALSIQVPFPVFQDRDGQPLDNGYVWIKFVITGSQNCLVPTDGVTVRNGSVELAGSGYTGHGGNGCPIIVGDYGLGTGHKNIKVENVTITSNKVGGNAFFITGDSENIVFENIEIPGPTVIANYGCHWGGANDPTAGTTHPHNIVMRNIKMGTSTHTTAIGAVTSGCYDVLMENLVFDNMPLHCVYIFCGDYGMEFATDANIKALGIHNIKVKNVTGKRVGYPVYIDMFKNVAPATPEKERCTSIMLENCSFFGNAPTDSTKFGFRLRYADNVVMQSCVFKNFYNAGRVTLSSNNNTFYNCEFSSSRLGGIFWTITGETSSTPSQRNTFENCLFKDNNQASSASISDIYLQWGGYNTIKDCKFDSPLIPWNVRTGTGATASFGNVVTGNLIVTPPTSVCFSFGSGTDYGIVTMFAGNRMANNTLVPVNGFAGGQLHLPFDTTPRAGQNRVASKYVGAAIPVANLWTVGDTVYYNAPAAGGKIGAVCVTEGTPGTWKEFGAIDA